EKITLFPVGVSRKAARCVATSDNINIGDVHVNCNESLPYKKPRHIEWGVVNVVPLDTLISEDVLFMKIDVEGHELFVLQGALHFMKEHSPGIIFTEYDEKAMKSLGVERPLDYLETIQSFGYIPFRTWVD